MRVWEKAKCTRAETQCNNTKWNIKDKSCNQGVRVNQIDGMGMEAKCESTDIGRGRVRTKIEGKLKTK